MAQTTVKISSRHQIAVPSAVREELGLGAGDVLVVDVQDGVILLTPAPADPVEALKGLGREVWEGVEVQEYIDAQRSDR